jgi:tRNA(adenine34) deaminase
MIDAMDVALAEADRAAAGGEVPVGAVVVHGGQIIARAHNLRETARDPLAHAEVLAIRAAAAHLGRWRLSGCTLVVTLEPCPMCAGAIVNSRVDRLVFGARDPRAGAVGSLMDVVRDARLNHRAAVVSGVRQEACGAVLKEFFAHRRQENKRSSLSSSAP